MPSGNPQPARGDCAAGWRRGGAAAAGDAGCGACGGRQDQAVAAGGAGRRPGMAPAGRAAARRRWLPRLALGLASALAAVAIVLGVAVTGVQHRLDQAAAALKGDRDGTERRRRDHPDRQGQHRRHRHGRDVAPGPRPGLHGGRPAAAACRGELRAVADGPGRRPARRDGARSRPGQSARWSSPGCAVGDRVGLTVEPASGSPRPTSCPGPDAATWAARATTAEPNSGTSDVSCRRSSGWASR